MPHSYCLFVLVSRRTGKGNTARAGATATTIIILPIYQLLLLLCRWTCVHPVVPPDIIKGLATRERGTDSELLLDGRCLQESDVVVVVCQWQRRPQVVAAMATTRATSMTKFDLLGNHAVPPLSGGVASGARRNTGSARVMDHIMVYRSNAYHIRPYLLLCVSESLTRTIEDATSTM